MKLDKKKLKQMLLSYLRAAGAAVLVLFMAGETDAKTLALGFAAGFVGPIAKALDKSAPEFGVGSE